MNWFRCCGIIANLREYSNKFGWVAAKVEES
jgi:hypothetical protein